MAKENMRLTKSQLSELLQDARNMLWGGEYQKSLALSNLVVVEVLYRILDTQNNLDRSE